MLNQNELYKALMNGEDPEKLAAQFADMLNGAIDQKKKKEEADKKAAAARAAAQEKAKADAEAKAKQNAQKVADTELVLKCVQDYVKKYYPNLDISKLTAKDVIAILDSSSIEVKPMLDSFDRLWASVFNPSVARLIKNDPVAELISRSL